MNNLKLALSVALGVALIVLGFYSLQFTVPLPPSSTLQGPVSAWDGSWTVEEVSGETELTPDSPKLLEKEGDLYLEYGGSGSAACASNFTAIEQVGDQLKLTHRVGDGTATVCTEDYRYTWFKLTPRDTYGEEKIKEVVVGHLDEKGTFQEDQRLTPSKS